MLPYTATSHADNLQITSEEGGPVGKGEDTGPDCLGSSQLHHSVSWPGDFVPISSTVGGRRAVPTSEDGCEDEETRCTRGAFRRMDGGCPWGRKL